MNTTVWKNIKIVVTTLAIAVVVVIGSLVFSVLKLTAEIRVNRTMIEGNKSSIDQQKVILERLDK